MTAARLAIALAVVTALIGIGGLWWWALLGMTPEVGTALLGTTVMAALGAVCAWLAATWESTR